MGFQPFHSVRVECPECKEMIEVPVVLTLRHGDPDIAFHRPNGAEFVPYIGATVEIEARMAVLAAHVQNGHGQ